MKANKLLLNQWSRSPYTASGYFFDFLLAQVNFQIAETNLGNTKNILRIANEKFDIGKISKNEILQLQLEQLKAEKAAGIAKRDMEIATLNLRTYTDCRIHKIALDCLRSTIDMKVSTDKVLKEAYANRSDAIAFVRRIAEAKRDVAKAKGDNGLNATLTAQLGFRKARPNHSKSLSVTARPATGAIGHLIFRS